MSRIPEEIQEQLNRLSGPERAALIEVIWAHLRRGAPKETSFATWVAEVDAEHRPCGCEFTELIGEHCKLCKQPWPCHTRRLVEGYKQSQPIAMPAGRMQA